MATAESDPTLLRILVASDVHLGYGEKNMERAEDSFKSFSEVTVILLLLATTSPGARHWPGAISGPGHLGW